jgi:proteasome lid subunit RPN8/RPN11
MLEMTWKNLFCEYAKKECPNEACGLLAIIKGKETFWPCKNLAVGKHEFFIIDPDDWAECEDTGEIIGVIHSHPKGAATPSDTDRAACEHLGFPYYIYSIEHDHWDKLEPCGWKTPSLIGRKFMWGKYDCWSIISDWYLETKNIKLKEWKRPKRIKDFINDPLFEKGLPLTGFKKLPSNDDIQIGDVLLFQSITGNLDHVAVYIGDMMILNHNIKSLSCRELFDLKYQQSLKGVYRYAA